MIKITYETKAWLKSLIDGAISDEAVIKGFLKNYVIPGRTIEDVQDDLLRFEFEKSDCLHAMDRLRYTLEAYANAPESPESRTLEEVHKIVDSVRAGIPVQIDYADPDDTDEYVIRACW